MAAEGMTALGHVNVCRTYGAHLVGLGHPELTLWANLCRASGAPGTGRTHRLGLAGTKRPNRHATKIAMNEGRFAGSFGHVEG